MVKRSGVVYYGSGVVGLGWIRFFFFYFGGLFYSRCYIKIFRKLNVLFIFIIIIRRIFYY